MAAAEYSTNTDMVEVEEVHEDAIEIDQLLYPYGLDRVVDRIGVKVGLALEKAAARVKAAEDRLAANMSLLDESEEDQLLSLDFRNIPNNFKLLEETILPKFKFRLPNIWTEEYAPSLRPDDERLVHSPPPEVCVPIYLPNFVNGKIELHEVGVRSRLFAYISKSMNDLHQPEESMVVHEAHKSQRSDRELHTLPVRAKKRLAGAVSSHIDICSRGLKYYHTHTVSEAVSVNDNYHFATQKASKNLRMYAVTTELERFRDQLLQSAANNRVPLISDPAESQSRKHVSMATQTDRQGKSSFATYIELKRKMSQDGQPKAYKNRALRDWTKMNFLKNVSVKEYMDYKYDSNPDKYHWATTRRLHQRECKNKVVTTPKKGVTHLVPILPSTELSKKSVTNTGTIAIAPSHSIGLDNVKSSTVNSIWKSIEKNREQPKPSQIRHAAITPTRIIPTADEYRALQNIHSQTATLRPVRDAHCLGQIKSLNSFAKYKQLRPVNNSEHSCLTDRASSNQVLPAGFVNSKKCGEDLEVEGCGSSTVAADGCQNSEPAGASAPSLDSSRTLTMGLLVDSTQHVLQELSLRQSGLHDDRMLGAVITHCNSSLTPNSKKRFPTPINTVQSNCTSAAGTYAMSSRSIVTEQQLARSEHQRSAATTAPLCSPSLIKCTTNEETTCRSLQARHCCHPSKSLPNTKRTATTEKSHPLIPTKGFDNAQQPHKSHTICRVTSKNLQLGGTPRAAPTQCVDVVRSLKCAPGINWNAQTEAEGSSKDAAVKISSSSKFCYSHKQL